MEAGLFSGERLVISSPSIYIFPKSGFKKPSIVLNTVVFPHPLGPKIQRSSPLLTLKLKLLTAIRLLNFLVRFSIFINISFLQQIF